MQICSDHVVHVERAGRHSARQPFQSGATSARVLAMSVLVLDTSVRVFATSSRRLAMSDHQSAAQFVWVVVRKYGNVCRFDF